MTGSANDTIPQTLTPDFESDAFIADPYPAYRRLREHAPVHQSPWGDWYLSRHADAERVLRDPCFVREAPGGGSPLADNTGQSATLDAVIREWLVFRDPPYHTALRSWMSQYLNRRSFEAMTPRIEKLTSELLDAAAAVNHMEVVGDLAYPLPVMVIAEVLGLPASDRHLYEAWSRDLTRALDRGLPEDMAAAEPAIVEMLAYLAQIVAERRRRPHDDFVTALARAELDGRALSDDEVLATLVSLLWAGHETTRNLIGNGLLILLQNPEQCARLRREPALMRKAIEEFLRFESPVQKISRWTTQAIAIGTERLPAGSFVVCLLGAANRDPLVFTDPERVDIERRGNPHLAFGSGIHTCIGAHLARLEGRIALTTMLQRFPELIPSSPDFEWRRHSAFRSLKYLHVMLGR
jgi:pimeloyl-[acyl-carrier protein] synthase